MIVSEASQASRVRVSGLAVEIYRVLMAYTEANPDLTYEEILAALLDIQRQQVGHLIRLANEEAAAPATEEEKP